MHVAAPLGVFASFVPGVRIKLTLGRHVYAPLLLISLRAACSVTFDFGKCRDSCVVAFPWAFVVQLHCDISSCEDLY